jgi:GGDEF domain-containing protein
VLEAVAALAATALRNLHLLTQIQSSRRATRTSPSTTRSPGSPTAHASATSSGPRSRAAPRSLDGAAGAGNAAVLLVDLDGFKAVNDGLGHEAGDALLVAVARRLLNATRGSDTVARLGGDEFAVVLDRVREPREATVVAERVVQALRIPFSVRGRR